MPAISGDQSCVSGSRCSGACVGVSVCLCFCASLSGNGNKVRAGGSDFGCSGSDLFCRQAERSANKSQGGARFHT